MKAKMKGLMALWLAAILVVSMMLPMGAEDDTYYIDVYIGSTQLEPETYYDQTMDNISGISYKNGDKLDELFLNQHPDFLEEDKMIIGWNRWILPYGEPFYSAESIDRSDYSLTENDQYCLFEPILGEATASDPGSDSHPTGSSLLAILLMMRNVKFYDGDIQVERVNVFRGKTIDEPEAPVKDGMIFDGWYTNTEFTEKFDFGTKINGFLKLYAKWIPAAE